MGSKASQIKFLVSSDEVFLSKISYLANACDCVDNLHILIYLLSEKRFIYSNDALKRMVAGQSHKLLEEGWSYWYSMINEKERLSVENSLNELFLKPCTQTPYVLKYYVLNENGAKIHLRHEILFHCLGNQMLAINYFFDITEKETIEAYLQTVNNGSADFFEDRAASVSPREKEVLKLVADGFSSKQIADRLFISSHTAISHRKNLIEKFNVKNTAQLIKRASRTIELW